MTSLTADRPSFVQFITDCNGLDRTRSYQVIPGHTGSSFLDLLRYKILSYIFTILNIWRNQSNCLKPFRNAKNSKSDQAQGHWSVIWSLQQQRNPLLYGRPLQQAFGSTCFGWPPEYRLNAWSYRVRQAGNFGSSMLKLGHLQVTWLTRCNTWKFSIGSTRFCFWRWKSHTSEIIFQTVAFNQFKMLFILVTLKLKISKRFLSASSSFYQHKFLQNRDSNHRKLLMISQKN